MELTAVENFGSNLEYLGNSEYRRINYINNSGYTLQLTEALKDPIDYSISDNSIAILTERVGNNDVFNPIKTKRYKFDDTSLFAAGQNIYEDFEDLSAIGIDEGKSTILGIYSDFNSIISNEYEFSTFLRMDKRCINVSGSEVTLIREFDVNKLTEENYFYIKFLDEIKCRVIINQEDITRVLCYNPNSGKFLAEDIKDVGDTPLIFELYYSYDTDSHNIMLIVPGYGPIASDLDDMTLKIGIFSQTQQDIFWGTITNNNLSDEISVEESFLALYGSDIDIDAKYPIDSNRILTENYKPIEGRNSNCITLKTNIPYDDTHGKTNVESETLFRNYSSVNTGYRGNNKFTPISLTYINDNIKYDFKPDSITYFHTPSNLGKWDQININDTTLIANGAIGGTSPLNSDKVYKRLYEYSKFTNSGSTVDIDNGHYLCSWLFYDPSDARKSIWLDRYYNPDRVRKLDALSENGWNYIKGLNSVVDTNKTLFNKDFGDYYKEFDKDVGVFDVVSSLTFQPDCMYIYHHIGEENSKELLSELDRYLILEDIDGVKLDFNETKKLNYSNVVSEGDFTISFAVSDLNMDELVGSMIVGNSDYGLYYDETYTPFIVKYHDRVIYIYDCNYNLFNMVELPNRVRCASFLNNIREFLIIDELNNIYLLEVSGYVKNSTSKYSGINFLDIRSGSEGIYILDDNGVVYLFDKNSFELTTYEEFGSVDGSLIHIDANKNIELKTGNVIDYDSRGNAYILDSDNTIFKNKISSKMIVSENEAIKDFVIDAEDRVFIITNSQLHEISQDGFSPHIVNTYTIVYDELDNEEELEELEELEEFNNINIIKTNENGGVKEYIDVYTTDRIIRFNKNLNIVKEFGIGVDVGFRVLSKSNYFNQKFNTKSLRFKISLRNSIGDLSVRELVFDIPEKVVNESNRLSLNFSLNNRFGNANLYCNGRKLSTYEFDVGKYSYMISNDSKVFVGGDNVDSERFIYEVIPNNMKTGNLSISDIMVHDKSLDYFEISHYVRMFGGSQNSSLILPIKNRGYVEEINGYFIQNKDLRKSEYGRLNIYCEGLRGDMIDDIKSYIAELMSDTFINNKLVEINFFQNE